LIDRRVIQVLLVIFAVVLVSFAIFVSFAALHQALGDETGGSLLRIAAGILGMAGIIDLIMLVVVLALNACMGPDDESGSN